MNEAMLCGVNVPKEGLEIRITVSQLLHLPPPPGPLESPSTGHLEVKQGRAGYDVAWHSPQWHPGTRFCD